MVGTRLCIYRMCMNFIDSCQSLVSGRVGWMKQRKGGKKTTGMQEIVRLMYTEVVRIRDVFFVFSSVSFFLFFPFFFFF